MPVRGRGTTLPVPVNERVFFCADVDRVRSNMKMRILPRSLWLAYPITRLKTIAALLPERMTIGYSPLVNDNRMKMQAPKLLFNAYEVESPWMCGTRVDVCVLAQHCDTGRLHLVVLDCLSDVMRWNPRDGIQSPNARRVRQSIDDGYHMCIKNSRDALCLSANVMETCNIDWRFSVEANRVCFYQKCNTPFSMRFNETLVAQPVRRLNVDGVRNTLWSHVRGSRPTHAFIHPHEMTFDVDIDFVTGRNTQSLPHEKEAARIHGGGSQ